MSRRAPAGLEPTRLVPRSGGAAAVLFVAASIATVPLGLAAEKRGYHPGQLAAQLDDPERVRDGE